MKDLTQDLCEEDGAMMGLIPWQDMLPGGEPKLLTSKPTEVAYLVPAPTDQTQGFAVVRPFGPGRIAVLGYLSVGHIQNAVGMRPVGDWLEIRHGKAALRMNADGRIRVEGVDVRLEAQKTCALDAAEITLN